VKALPAATRRWLALEQTVNDRRINPLHVVSLSGSQDAVWPEYRPERRPVWPLAAIFVPSREAHSYGNHRGWLATRLRLHVPGDQDVVFVHPQSIEAYRRYIDRYGLVRTRILATPTSSHRSLLAWNPASPDTPVIVKVSLFVVMGGVLRDVDEGELARSTVATMILDGIDPRVRAANGFEFFADVGGAALQRAGKAWILRSLPESIVSARSKTMVPFFSLCSAQPGEPDPILARAIRRSGRSAAEFLCERIIDPYVRVFSYLLLVEGLGIEAHSQNVLCEMTEDLEVTGKIAFRDLAGWGAFVNLALRAARGRGVPDALPARRGDIRCTWADLTNAEVAHQRASEGVVRYGMHQVVWELYRGLRPYFPALRLVTLRAHFLQGWKRACLEHLRVDPVIAPGCISIPLDEAIDAFLLHHEWRGAPAGRPPRRLMSLTRASVSAFRPQLQVATNWGRLLIEPGRSVRLDPAPVRFAGRSRSRPR